MKYYVAIKSNFLMAMYVYQDILLAFLRNKK